MEDAMDPVEKYLEVFEGLRRRKRWSTGIEAQQAAMIACMAACTVTTAAATS